ncbi:MAG: FitA-like ribbon-helix-helix domain-containing protein [Solirubrobacteraceae bacterium]
MATVQIKNVPPDVHQILRDRAGKAGQSLQAYLLAQLQEQASKPTIKELMDRVSKRTGGDVSFEFATKVIREDRDARS